VEYDHLAFLYWAPEEIVVLPMQEWNSNFVGAVVLKTDDGVREVGRITHEPDDDIGTSDCRQVDLGRVRRSSSRCAAPTTRADDGLLLRARRGRGHAGRLRIEGVEVGPDERVEVCWSNYYGPAQITRSLVIGDTLWTLSWLGLQANALDGFGITGEVPLG